MPRKNLITLRLFYFCGVEKLSQHIEKLLAHHDYVVVPNLGGFVVQIESAQVLTDRIIAPNAYVSFNPLMQHTDGLLAIEIARSEQVSYRVAMEAIEKEVATIKFNLDKIGYYHLGAIGKLRQDENGKIIFLPSEHANFLPQNFQLSDLYFQNKDSRNKESKKNITLSLPKASIYKYAAVAVLIIGLFFTTPKVNDMRVSADASLAPISLLRNIKTEPKIVKTEIKTDSIPATTVIEKDSVVTTAKDVAATVKTEKTQEKAIEQSKNYHVIIASLSTHEAAERLCKEMASANYRGAHILPPEKTYRVAIQSFSSKTEAIKYMENLRLSDSKFETAWVLCND